jgi:hypothetical protein
MRGGCLITHSAQLLDSKTFIIILFGLLVDLMIILPTRSWGMVDDNEGFKTCVND